MLQPSSATIVSAVRRATPGMVSRCATASASAAVHVAMRPSQVAMASSRNSMSRRSCANHSLSLTSVLRPGTALCAARSDDELEVILQHRVDRLPVYAAALYAHVRHAHARHPAGGEPVSQQEQLWGRRAEGAHFLA